MRNDEIVQILAVEDGLTTVEITERLGKTDTHTNRQNTYKKLWTLRKYDIIRSESVANPRYPDGQKYNYGYFLTDATREELEKGRAEPDEEYYELKESILAISEDFHVQ